MAHPIIEDFLADAPGQFFNPDNMHGWQCKDLIDAYCATIFRETWQSTITPGNANQVFATAKEEFFVKVKEIPGKVGQIPPRGSVIIWAGDSRNPFGHIAIVLSSTDYDVTVLQMDGFLQVAAFVGKLTYDQLGTGKVIGWLIPREEKLGNKVVELWMPGAVREPQGLQVNLNRSLPPRATWHITWDKLTNGVQPPFDNVANYLKNMKYCPHLMWDPITGRIVQYYPADVGSRALLAWGEDGRFNIQVEVYFAPGTIRNGKKYNTVAETPLVNFDKILNWMDSLGIPRRWPMGAPNWTGNRRDPNVWNNNAGHYGHCHVPDNTNTDPGPMPSLTASKEWWEMPIPDNEVKKITTPIIDYVRAMTVGGYNWSDGKHPGGFLVVEENQRRINALRAELQVTRETLVAAIAKVAGGEAFDEQKLLDGIEARFAKVLREGLSVDANADVNVTVTGKPTPNA